MDYIKYLWNTFVKNKKFCVIWCDCCMAVSVAAKTYRSNSKKEKISGQLFCVKNTYCSRFLLFFPSHKKYLLYLIEFKKINMKFVNKNSSI